MSSALQKVWIKGRWIRLGHVVAYGEPAMGEFEIGRVVRIDVDSEGEEVVLVLNNGQEPLWPVFADCVTIVKGL